MIELKERMLRIVSTHRGLKKGELAAILSVEFINLPSVEIRQFIESMIADGELVEIAYCIPNSSPGSFVLPQGTALTIAK